jgi:hypothetical protein
MDNEHPQDQESSSTERERKDVVASRRRFTHAGLTGSVVLGALASKPVLGAVPYPCTVSGQVSGNLSRPDLAASCVIGASRSTWLAATSWSPTFVKGTLPNPQNCNFEGNESQSPPVPRVKGTEFNAFSAGGVQLIGAFYNSSSGSLPCMVGTNFTSNSATMLQVLASTTSGEQFQLGRAVVVSLLNAGSLGINYPVTMPTIINMFNATFAGGSYQVNSTTSWMRFRVIQYLESLYPPG